MKIKKDLTKYIVVTGSIIALAIILSFAITGNASKSGNRGSLKFASQCNDGLDNDGDGYCDFIWRKVKCTDGSIPGDPDCTSKEDNEESGSYDCSTGGCSCSEQNGFICSEGEYCPGVNLMATDTNVCCSQQCEIPSCTTCNTCGSGLFNTCDRAECYSCESDNCYFKDNIFVDNCNSCITINSCSDYGEDQVSCYDDPCNFGNCTWQNNACLSQTTTGSFIERTFSSSTVSAGGEVTVNLAVSITGGETYYAVEENIPLGWNVINKGGGETTDPNRLAWVVISDISDRTYTYVIQAPNSAGDYSFYGNYMFENFANPKGILGENLISVI